MTAIEGEPVLIKPPGINAFMKNFVKPLIATIIVAVASPYLLYVLLFRRRKEFLSTYNSIVGSEGRREDEDLAKRVWKSQGAQFYTSTGALEYQNREGFCSSATMRCVLKSFKNKSNDAYLFNLPEQVSKPQDCEEHIQTVMNNITSTGNSTGNDKTDNQDNEELSSHSLEMEIHRFSEGDDKENYERFLSLVRLLNHPSGEYRISINYLRSALLGVQFPWAELHKWPMKAILALFGGHFSPVIGFLEPEDSHSHSHSQEKREVKEGNNSDAHYTGTGNNNDNNDNNVTGPRSRSEEEEEEEEGPLVAVFDVNAEYGLCVVAATALYRAVRTQDVMSGKERGLLLTRVCKRENKK